MRTLSSTAASLLLILTLIACSSSGTGGDASIDPDDTSSTEPVESTPVEPGDSSGAVPGASSGPGWTEMPCDLLTTDEIGGVMGVADFAAQPVIVAPGSALCGYRSASVDSEVVLSVYAGEGAVGQSTTMRFLLDQGAEGMELVDGVAEQAIYSQDTLAVTENGSFVLVKVRKESSVDPATVRPLAIELGRLVAGRLSG
jgi:hypothetical protein